MLDIIKLKTVENRKEPEIEATLRACAFFAKRCILEVRQWFSKWVWGPPRGFQGVPCKMNECSIKLP